MILQTWYGIRCCFEFARCDLMYIKMHQIFGHVFIKIWIILLLGSNEEYHRSSILSAMILLQATQKQIQTLALLTKHIWKYDASSSVTYMIFFYKTQVFVPRHQFLQILPCVLDAAATIFFPHILAAMKCCVELIIFFR